MAEESREIEGDPIVRCSQHGFRGTPRCNDNPACILQDGVWVREPDRLNDPVAFGERLIQNLGYQIYTDYADRGEVTVEEVTAAKVALFDRLVEPYIEAQQEVSVAGT